MTDASAIDLHSVRKTYRGRIEALRGVDLAVGRGEVFGLLGPNGAGKSTIVKIMMTVVRATEGGGTLLGAPLGDKAALARVGYLPEHHRFPAYLTGRQVVDFFGALAGMRRVERRGRTEAMLDLVRMRDWADRRLGTYSKGMQQRVGLAASLVNDPMLVVLDEPTDGVDPVGRKEIRDLLLRLRAEGRTIFVNSHLLSEIEMVCDRVAIMVQGRVWAQGTIDDLTRSSRRFEITIRGTVPEWAAAHGVVRAEQGASTIVLQVADAADAQPVIDRLRASGSVIERAVSMRESLEDLFIRAVTDPSSGGTLNPGALRDRPSAPPPPVEVAP
ncbi:MAG: ATP-binding cassette domain-containing protein [Phycisphaerales bacterium]